MCLCSDLQSTRKYMLFNKDNKILKKLKLRKSILRRRKTLVRDSTQVIFTCSKSTIEILEKGGKYV